MLGRQLLAALIGVVVCASGGVAYGHAALNAEQAEAGALTTLEFRITHGCDGSPTTRVELALPDGIVRASPRMLAGWTVRVEREPLAAPITLHGQTVTERPARIIWEGGSIPDGVYEQFEVRLETPNRPGETVLFPVRQECANGGTYAWADDPAAGTPHPALALRLTASSGHRH